MKIRLQQVSVVVITIVNFSKWKNHVIEFHIENSKLRDTDPVPSSVSQCNNHTDLCSPIVSHHVIAVN